MQAMVQCHQEGVACVATGIGKEQGCVLQSSKGFFYIITQAPGSTLKLPALQWRKLEKPLWGLRELVQLTCCVTSGKLLTLSGPAFLFYKRGGLVVIGG